MALTRLLVALFAASLWLSPALTEAQDTRPNIVVLLADDLGHDIGPTLMPRTHAIKQAKGTRLHFYAMQNCTPTRVALMTGKHPYRFDLHSVWKTPIDPGLPVEERILPEYLSETGYSTGVFGKWHLGYKQKAQWPNARGFDEFIGFLGGYIESYGTVGTGYPYDDNTTGHDHHGMHDFQWNGIPFYSPKYSTHLFRDAAVKFVKDKAPKDEPFFLYVPFNAPHGPLSAPREYMQRAAALPGIDSSRMDELTEFTGEVLGVGGPYSELEYDTGPLLYAASVMALDDAVADIYQAIEDSGEADNTLFLFASDNGPNDNIHPVTKTRYILGNTAGLSGGKGSAFEGGPYVENFIVWPDRMSPGQVVSDNIWVCDLMPTFLELAGITIPHGLDGDTAVNTLTNNQPMWRRGFGPFVCSYIRKNTAPARNPDKTLYAVGDVSLNYQRMKYIVYREFGADQQLNDVIVERLFDLASDPGEKNNLANDPNFEAELNLMRTGYEWLGGDTTFESIHRFERRDYPWRYFDPTDEFGFYDNEIPLQTSIGP